MAFVMGFCVRRRRRESTRTTRDGRHNGFPKDGGASASSHSAERLELDPITNVCVVWRIPAGFVSDDVGRGEEEEEEGDDKKKAKNREKPAEKNANKNNVLHCYTVVLCLKHRVHASYRTA